MGERTGTKPKNSVSVFVSICNVNNAQKKITVMIFITVLTNIKGSVFI